MALKDLTVTHSQARAMRVINRWLLAPEDGRTQYDRLRDEIAAEIGEK